LELQGVSRTSLRVVWLALLGALLALIISISLPASAGAASGLAAPAATTTADPNTPVLVTDETKPPTGYRLTALQARSIAASSPKIVDELHRHPHARVYEYTKGPGRWQVSWFGAQTNGPELAQVYVDDATGRVTEAWTGFQVAWTMARGYKGAFGRRVNALYVWIPLCVLFVAPFIPWRRRPTLWHLDLLVLLGFSVSMAFFNHGEIGLSVPLAYPFLVYLLARMLLLAFGRVRPREPLRLIVPASWLAVAIVFLVGFRIGLNVTNSNVIDVGYAGVIGADKLLHGHHLYGHWPKDNAFGDTYGPVNYYAYVPFRAIFGWSGLWDDLPAAHAAAIAFDLLTLLGLYFLGRLIRGPTMGTVLAYAWASYPFTIYALSSNSNDTLVAFLMVLALLVIRSAPARGVALGLAGMAKFVPFVLGPLFLRGAGDWPKRRALVAFCVAVGATIVITMLPVLLDGNLSVFWHDSLRSQIDRVSPFSIWGLWGGLKLEQHLVQGFCVGLAIAVAFVPRRRGIVEVCALGAAVVIALQLGLTHWFYLYIPWFFPLLIVALVGAHPAPALAEAPERDAGAETSRGPLRGRREPEPTPA
jgi:hypothetical protein